MTFMALPDIETKAEPMPPRPVSEVFKTLVKYWKYYLKKIRLPREILRWGIGPHQLLVRYACSLSLVLFPLVFFMWNMWEELDILHNSSAGLPTTLQWDFSRIFWESSAIHVTKLTTSVNLGKVQFLNTLFTFMYARGFM